MNALPLVSVVIPAYNAEGYIGEALDSVLAQDYGALEIIVVDDGSRDGTSDVVRQKAPQARIIRQANAGVAVARNTGLAAASGCYVCLLDADDGWLPGKLHAQVAYLEAHPDVGLVYHAWKVRQPDMQGVYLPLEATVDAADPAEIVSERSGWIYPALLLDCIVHTSTVMMRKAVIERMGYFDTRLIAGEDYDYWLRVSREFRIDKLAATYSFYRCSVVGSLTYRPKTVNFEYVVLQRALRRWGRRAPDGTVLPAVLVRKRLAKLAFDFAYAHYHNGSKRLACGGFARTIMHAPGSWKAYAYLLLSIVGSVSGS